MRIGTIRYMPSNNNHNTLPEYNKNYTKNSRGIQDW